ncbi:MAG: hypothetical protein ACJAS1_004544 [Oleiphilaceae bacterium]|jgi:hypothetical protein
MHNLNKITKNMSGIVTLAGIATVYLIGSSNVFAESVTTATVSATVQNTFTLAETTALSFGTVRATNDNTNVSNFASLVLSPAGVLTPGSQVGASKLTSLSAGTGGVFTVSGAATFTDLTVTFPANFTLTSPGAPPGSAVFNIIEANWVGKIVGGANDGVALNGTFDNLQTDVNGAVVLNVGTTLDTDILGASTTSGYLDAAYTGTYTMDISY